MSETLPEPLTPAHCDLRGLEWMPLFGDRLFASDTWLMGSPEARCAAMMLWWESWKQCPAGSLPDHDRALAQLSGYGMSLKAWLSVKAEAMRGWVKCDDGRLYHPVVCELAREAWDRRLKERERKAAYRAKKDGTNGNVPRDNGGTNEGHDTGQDRDEDGDEHRDCHVEKTVQYRTGQDRTFKKERKKDRDLRSLDRLTPNDDEFEALFWPIYPRKVGKDAARKAWLKARRQASADEITEGLRRYPFVSEPDFQPHASTWLNEGRWKIEANTAPVTVRVNGRDGAAANIVREYGLDLITPIDEQFPSPARISHGSE